MLGGGLNLPIFTGGRRVANLRLKKDEYERILNNYRKTNLTAIQEVNDAMVSIKLDHQNSQTLKSKQNLKDRISVTALKSIIREQFQSLI